MGGGQWEPGARSSISSSVFAMRIAVVVVVAVSLLLRPVVVVVVAAATFLVNMLCVCVCVDAGACCCVCALPCPGCSSLQNKNILCNSLKAIFRFRCCCWVFALFFCGFCFWNLGRISGRIGAQFDRHTGSVLHLQLLLLEISNWKKLKLLQGEAVERKLQDF